MHCLNCKKTAPSAIAAIELGWIPSYWDRMPTPDGNMADVEITGPFCPDCIVSLGLVYDADSLDYSFPVEV